MTKAGLLAGKFSAAVDAGRLPLRTRSTGYGDENCVWQGEAGGWPAPNPAEYQALMV
jgi:hypothetical protein